MPHSMRVSMDALIKKGLRLIAIVTDCKHRRFDGRPDQEGIKTFNSFDFAS